MLPLVKLLPLIVSVCSRPLATIAVGETLFTVGAGTGGGTTGGVTVIPTGVLEQLPSVLAISDRHTRTKITSATVPGSI